MTQKSESLLPIVAPLAGMAMLCAGLLAAPALAAAPAKTRLQPQVTAEGEPVGFRVKSQPLAIAPINLDVSKFAFTVPGRVASSRLQTVERGFTFTPSRSGRNGVSLGVTTRSATTADRSAATESGLAPSGYNVDLSLGYKGFAVSGGMSRVDSGLTGRGREGVDVGLGYNSKAWRAGVLATAERENSYLLPRTRGDSETYAVEARGALALSPSISVGGSLRYRPAPQNPTPLDPNKDDRAVMLGGAVAF